MCAYSFAKQQFTMCAFNFVSGAGHYPTHFLDGLKDKLGFEVWGVKESFILLPLRYVYLWVLSGFKGPRTQDPHLCSLQDPDEAHCAKRPRITPFVAPHVLEATRGYDRKPVAPAPLGELLLENYASGKHSATTVS